MDKLNKRGILLKKLNIIPNNKGDIYHGLKVTDDSFSGFGEAYFSRIKSGQTKGWKKHKKMTLNLIVPIGEVDFFIYDNRFKKQEDAFFKVTLSEIKYYRLTVPPMLWLAFSGKSKLESLILNIANIEHDPLECINKDFSSIPLPNKFD